MTKLTGQNIVFDCTIWPSLEGILYGNAIDWQTYKAQSMQKVHLLHRNWWVFFQFWELMMFRYSQLLIGDCELKKHSIAFRWSHIILHKNQINFIVK